MSDETPVPKRLQQWFAAKHVSDSCPLCSHKSWGVLRNPDGAVTAPTSAAAALPAFALACRNCGFVRWHIAELLDEASDPDASGDR